MEKLEQLLQMIGEIKDALKDKDTSLAEVREQVQKMSEDFTKKLDEARKEFEEKIATRKTPAVGMEDTPDVKSALQRKAYDEKTKNLHVLADYIQLAYETLGASSAIKALEFWKQSYPEEAEILKTGMGTGQAGGGAEWVPTGYSRTLFEELMLALRVAQLHPKVNMPQNPYKFPIVYQDAQAYLVGENVDDTNTIPSDFESTKSTTGDFILNAKSIKTRVVISEELEQDSIIPVLPIMREQLIKALGRAIEDAIINGGNTGDANVPANSPRNAFDGYRALTLNEAKIDAGGSLTSDDLAALRKALGKYAVEVNDIAWVVPVSVYLGYLMTLKDSDGNNVLVTHEKYGDKATILTGEVGKIFGISVIVSEHIREDLNTSGVFDGTTTDYTELFLVNRPSFYIGTRQELKIESARKIELGQTRIVAGVRIAFGSPFSNRTVVGTLYNIQK